MSNPALHYINVETTNGAYRGQFSPAEEVVFLALMQPGNEVPPVDLNASAIGAFVVTVTRDSARAVTSASTEFDLLYNFPSQVTFTGLHVHSGAAGQNGPVVLDSGLSFTSSAMNGAGRIRRRREVDLANNTALQAISGVLANPRNFYMNIHTTDFPAGAARGQLRATGTVSFPLSLSSTDSANGLGELRIRSLRNEQGYVQAAYVDFLTNFNFPLATSLTGLQINEGLSGETGPVRFDPGFSASDFPTGASGFGTIFQRTFASGLDIVGALNLLLVSPQRYYLNVLTSANPAGALRAQIGTLLTGPPTINSIANGPLAPPSSGQTPVAPGSIIVLTGSNFTIASSDLQGWSGNNVPTLLNGVEVVMGNTPIPLLSVSPTRIVAQVPINTPEGSQPIEVRFNGNISAAQYVSVSSSAPVVFSYPNGVSALPNADIPAIGPTGPFRGGDTVTLWVSGLGQTTPALTNGRIAWTEAPYTVNQLTATVGGQNAQVISATAAPGLLGLYQVQLRIPNGLRAGSQPVMVQTQNGTISNTATLNVQ